MAEPDPLPAIKTPWRSATPPSGAGAGDVPPIPIPDHTIMRRIGKGSYGEVWLARNVLGVYRAVKIIHRESFDDVRPFEREFAGMQRFEPVSRSHESQLNILQVGRGLDCFYYVMELADDMGRGAAIDEASYTPRNLRSELLLRGRVPVDECVRLGLALTTALEHLHRHGLVHRDIKPSNIVFVNGIPKLADIGLVAQAEATMSFVGTEGYLPPEGPGTVQADLFSLGKVLYEISTGRDRQQFPELPTNVVELPDRAALAEFNEVLLRACAPDVKQRYESAAEMHADLALLQSGKSVSRMRAVERRLKFVARAGAVVTGIALLAGVAFFYQQLQTREARRLASENQVLATEKTKLADNLTKLGEENRERIVRLDIANGVRLLDDNDPSAALLWFADALPLVTNNPAVEEIHRIRIQQTLEQMPRLLQLFSDESGILASAFSPNGLRLATLTRFTRDISKLTMRDLQTGEVLWERQEPKDLRQLRFAHDGRRLFVCSSVSQGPAHRGAAPTGLQLATVVEVQTGKSVFPQLTSNLVYSAFSPDDRWLALALTNHVIQLLDIRDGHLVVELRGHTNEITMLTFSDDSSLLASGSLDLTARIWRLPTGEPVGVPFTHDQAVRRVALSADGRFLATANWEWNDLIKNRIQVWDVQNAKRVGETITETVAIRVLFFSPYVDALFTGGTTNGVRVWDVGSGVTLRQTLKFSWPRCWAFSPDKRLLALGTDKRFISIWNTATWELLFLPVHHTGWVESVHFSPDGSRLLTTSDDGTAKVWSLTRSTESARLTLSPNIRGFDDYSNHGLIPIELEDGRLHLVDPDRMVDIQALAPRQTNAPMAAWKAGTTARYWALLEPNLDEKKSPDRLTLWKKQDGGFSWQEITLPELGGWTQFNADDSRLVTVAVLGPNRILRIWRTSDGTLERSIPVPDSLQFLRWDIIFRPFDLNLRTLLSLGVDPDDNGYVQAFDLASGQFIGQPFAMKEFGGEDQITRMCLSPEGTRLASVGQDQKGTVDLQTGKLAVPQFKHGGSLFSLNWSPDGKRLLTVGYGVKEWDTATGEMVGAPMLGDRYACWSADGRFIATKADDKSARVWDAATTEPVTPFLPHSDYIPWVCITPGNRLITSSSTNLLRAWDLKPTTLPADIIADYAKLLSGRRLNAGGVLLPIPAKELAELAKSLRARAPELFE